MYVLENPPALERTIARQAAQAGRPLPDKIANAPELQLGLQLYFQAFLEVDKERSQGFGPGPIPITRVLHYAEFAGFSEDQTEDFCYYVAVMDSAYLKWYASKNKPKGD